MSAVDRRSITAVLAATVLAVAGCSSGSDEPGNTPAATGGQGPLKIGSVLPTTAYAGAGEPLVAAVNLAFSDINEAGGVLGGKAELKQVDSTDNNDTAGQAVDSLVTWGADVVVGAYGSGMTGAIVQKVVDSGAVQISGSNTSSKLTGINKQYFRTAPTDALEAAKLADLIVQDGHGTVGMIAQNDAWGQAFQKELTEALDAAGVEVVAAQQFNTTDTDFKAQIDAVSAAKPEAVVLLAYASYAGTMIESLVGTRGYTDKNLYLSSSTLGEYTIKPELLKGLRGFLSAPSPAVSADFEARLKKIDSKLTAFAYAPATYDAVIVSALAAIAAKSTDGKAIAAKLPEVSGSSGNGTKCTAFKECADLLGQGKVIDYDGLSGGLKFDGSNDVTETEYQLNVYGADGKYAPRQ
ncbi:amino acid ABC transporter [Paractinoplanes deccanensis]|uniref:Amino acid ABC transporter n=1 Tax=Paractinoplanes deccanensis TaxID=113561 RepID=A0ABQ3XXR3_9ACTN|nr:ABC transporter substrate-binding protein [Actinoplanes deccanensis]GID72537.1 amino acid ABC transporter [Actinoplanes deccanensis]